MPSTEQQKQEEYNTKADAWNNLNAMLKFMVLEDYIKTATAHDIIASLNTLSPEAAERQEEIEKNIYDEEPKEQIGFVNQRDLLIKEIIEKLMENVELFISNQCMLSDENDYATLKQKLTSVIKTYINTEIPGE